ncbi:dihydrolipoamide acetyltransferase component of pyruvate dehydrogenase complex [Bacteroidota bacterium]|nr:dihydrolipoamide acetyltransferase component of pyruvate dehydrogenase complex [Bacteroidota bacterium]
MAEIIRMPRMSDTMEEGNIIGWLKKVGDKVEPGETLAEVETDKATMELDAFVEGTLLYIAVPEGTVAIDGIIAVIGQPGEDWQAAVNGAVATGSSTTTISAAEPNKQDNIPTPIVSDSNEGPRIKASPLAKSMAKESGINLGQIQGSGEGGRIVRKDVMGVKPDEAIAPTVAKTVAAPTQVVSLQTNATESSYEDKTVSQMRKTIARRLSESKFTAPHFYLSVEIDMERAMEVREQLNQNSDVRISYNDLVIRSVASALKKHAVINASWLGDRIRYNHEVHIGVAVAVEDGLLVPVIKHADRKTLSQINGEVKMLAGKAKDKKLQPDEMQGNTFTISNLGMFGIEEFTAIINPPDACILAVGGIIQKPVVKNGQIVVGNTMKVTLSCDHRVVDGASGAQFLQTLKSILEEPLLLLK